MKTRTVNFFIMLLISIFISAILVYQTPRVEWIGKSWFSMFISKYGYNLNEVIVDELERSNVEIYWLKEHKRILVYSSNKTKKVNKVGFKYGRNQFVVKVGEDEIIDMYHFKENYWYSNVYIFSINKNSDKTEVFLKVLGAN